MFLHTFFSIKYQIDVFVSPHYVCQHSDLVDIQPFCVP